MFKEKGSYSKVLERFFNKFSKYIYLDPEKERRRVWKGMFYNIFLTGSFLSSIPLVSWFDIINIKYFIIPIIIHAIVCVKAGMLFHLYSKREKGAKLFYFTGVVAFAFVGWLSFFASFMLLLATVGVLVRLPGRVWVYPLVVYLLIALGLWLGRREIPRASVEGSRDHPWVWVVRVFLSLSLGTCVLLTALVRIFLQVLERQNVTLALQFLAVFTFSLVPLFQGFAAWAWILAYLHYQKWRGVEELRL